MILKASKKPRKEELKENSDRKVSIEIFNKFVVGNKILFLEEI